MADDVALLRGQHDILEKVARGAPLRETLDRLAALIEAREPGLRCGVVVLDLDCARIGKSCGAGLPATFHAALEGFRLVGSPYYGACGEALDRAVPILVPDLVAEVRYAPEWRALLQSFGIRAVRSTPIIGLAGRVIGSFAMYFDRAGEPVPRDAGLIETATYLAAIAIERTREREDAERREARLRANADAFNALIQHAPFGVYLVDSDFRIAEASETTRRVFDGEGLGEGLIGTGLDTALRRIWPEPFASETIARFRLTLDTGESYVSTDTVERRADRDRLEAYDWRIERLTLPDGRFGVVCYFYDISERHQLESELRASEAGAKEAMQRLELAVDTAQLGTWELDVRSGAMTASDMCKRNIGQPTDVALDIGTLMGLIHAEDRDRVRRALFDTIEHRTDYLSEHRFVGADGQIHWMLTRARPSYGTDGRSDRVTGVALEITGRKMIETALRDSEERLRLATEHADVGFWDLDLVNDVLLWPPRVKAMFGVSPDASVSLALFFACLHPEDHDAVSAAYAAAIDPARRDLYDVEYRVVGKEDGRIRWVAAKGRAVFDAGDRCVRMVGVVTDISARRDAEASLAATEAALRRLNGELEQRVALAIAERDSAWRLARDMFIVVDSAGTFLSANPVVSEILGWTERDLIGKPSIDFVHPDDAASSIEALAHATAAVLPVFENRWRHRDGSWRTISWAAAPEAGRVFAYGRDVTAEREAARQLAAAQTQVAHLQRMEALGQLAGGIAHDFNNVLQAVQGGAGLIEKRCENPEGVRRLSRMIFDAAGRGSAITRRLLSFSRRGDLRAEAVDPAALLSDMREILAHTLGAGIRVCVDAAAELPMILVDKGQFETVLVNLATNARDAMSGNGLLSMSAVAEMVPGAAVPKAPSTLEPGGYLRLSVEDNGVGMPADVLAKVTEPFFTTKPLGKGTGLGLAMARGFIEQSGGSLRIASEVGRGTTITIWLPTAPSSPRRADAALAATAASDRTARLLVVDDEPMLRKVIGEQLEAAGYEIRSAANAAEAIALMEASEPFDLLVSDLSMPGMNGVALVQEVNRRWPGVPAILLTGYATSAAELAVSHAVEGTFALLRKPVTQQELAERVAMVLDAASPPPASSRPWLEAGGETRAFAIEASAEAGV